MASILSCPTDKGGTAAPYDPVGWRAKRLRFSIVIILGDLGGYTPACEPLLGVADDLAELGLEFGLGRQERPVLGDNDPVLVQFEELDLLTVGRRA